MNNLIKIVFNNYCGENSRLTSGWGFSAWINFSNKNILFDTGADGNVLLKNMREMNLNPGELDLIFISHVHSDHTGGLSSLIKKIRPGIPVYIPEADSNAITKQIPEMHFAGVKSFAELERNIWTTGSLKGIYKGNEISEQSLILKCSQSLLIVTGCSHPGIENIADAAKRIFPETCIDLIAGGFHLMMHKDSEYINCSLALKNYRVMNIAPSHCITTNGTEIFRNEWQTNFIELYLGGTYKIISDL